MKKIFSVLTLMLFAALSFAQVQSFAVWYTPTTVTNPTANTYRIVGQVLDINGVLNATNAQVGDSLHMVQEGRIYALVMTTKHSAAGTLLDATFTSVGQFLVSSSPSLTVEGVCNLARVNGKGYIGTAAALPNPLQEELENRFRQNVAGRSSSVVLTPVGVTSTGTSSGWNLFEEVNTFASGVVRTLPPATSVDIGSRITYKNTGTFAFTVARNGTDLLNGGTTSVTVPVGEALSILCNGTGQAQTYSNLNSSNTSVFSFASTNTNGATLEYFVLTGTPVVTFSKVGGVGTTSVTGGTIKWSRIQVDLNTSTDVDASSNFALIVNGLTSTNTAYHLPLAMLVDTKAGVAPSATNFVYKNQGSAPVLSISAATIGSSVTIKSVSSLAAVGGTVSLVTVF